MMDGISPITGYMAGGHINSSGAAGADRVYAAQPEALRIAINALKTGDVPTLQQVGRDIAPVFEYGKGMRVDLSV